MGFEPDPALRNKGGNKGELLDELKAISSANLRLNEILRRSETITFPGPEKACNSEDPGTGIAYARFLFNELRKVHADIEAHISKIAAELSAFYVHTKGDFVAGEALRESEEQFRVLSETSPAAIFMYQGNKLIYANPAAVRFTGFTMEDMLRKDFWDMVHPKYREMVKRIGLARQRGEPVSSRYEVQYITSAGEVRWAEFAAGRIEYKGKPAGIVIALDITDRKRAEVSLHESKAQAELYVDLMGHDINNLNQVALGYLELATDRLALDDTTREFILKPMEALEKSSKLIEKVKKLQMMKSGHLETKTVDVGNILEDVITTYSAIPGRDITINYTPTHGLVSADELLTDVFSNLVLNGIKHSPCDKPLVIDIGLWPVVDDGVAYLMIAVDDNGPGIPDNRKDSVFGRFSKGGDSVKGSGLGLYLVKSLVESYGGSVWVENRVAGNYREGSRFVVMLPAVE